ncbi:MAG: methyltransferase domain-containing protein [bacterium]|nr:methyltransferase domain-containing protein [bacterium]
MSADSVRTLSHGQSGKELADEVEQIRRRILARGDQPHAKTGEILDILDQLQDFAFGRFLLLHKGVNGYWTDFLAYRYPLRREELEGRLKPLEEFLFARAPVMVATQERLQIFQKLAQEILGPGARLGSVPCGLMADLLGLDFSGIDEFELWGIDIDEESIRFAAIRAEERNLSRHAKFMNRDAWALGIQEELDALLSSGLNFYVKDEDQEIALYHQFRRALKPGGVLILSFFPPPPDLVPDSIWNISEADSKNLQVQKVIFADILEAKWQNFRSPGEIQSLLERAGFSGAEFYYDSRRIMPTIRAVRV